MDQLSVTSHHIVDLLAIWGRAVWRAGTWHCKGPALKRLDDRIEIDMACIDALRLELLKSGASETKLVFK